MTSTKHDGLFDDLTRAIDENGTLTEETRKRLMLMTIREVYANTKGLPDRIEALERKSILMIIDKHPKLSTFLSLLAIVVMFTLFSIWTETGAGAYLMRILGF